MKTKINNYVFNPVSRTILFTDYNSSSPIALDDVLMITNVTTGTIIYLFSDHAKGGSVTNGNMITLLYDTSSMSASDQLQIWVDTGIEYPVTQKQLNDTIMALKSVLVSLANPAYVDKSANQLRAQITGTISTLTTLTTCTTVTTVGTVSNMGNYPATMGVFDINNAAWAAVSRSTLA